MNASNKPILKKENNVKNSVLTASSTPSDSAITTGIKYANEQKVLQLLSPDVANSCAPLPFPGSACLVCMCCPLQGIVSKSTPTTYYQKHGFKCPHYGEFCEWVAPQIEAGTVTLPEGTQTGLEIKVPPKLPVEHDDSSDEQKLAALSTKNDNPSRTIEINPGGVC